MHALEREQLTLGKDMIGVARHMVGAAALDHTKFSPACEPNRMDTLPACWEQGVDTRGFDCSGLMIYAAKQVADANLWPSHLRHVRQWWAASQRNEAGLQLLWEREPGLANEALVGRCAVGDLLIMRRKWGDYDGAGHIGLVTGKTAEDTPVLLHAASVTGRVVERPMRTLDTVMGAIAVTPAVVLQR